MIERIVKLAAFGAFPLTACAWVGMAVIGYAIAKDLEQAEIGSVD